jgi:hypothetical protein
MTQEEVSYYETMRDGDIRQMAAELLDDIIKAGTLTGDDRCRC